MTSEEAWEPFTVEEAGWPNCDVFHIKPGFAENSGLTWASCGEGCGKMDLTWFGDDPGASSMSHVDFNGSKKTLLAANWTWAPYGVRLLLDIETGAVLNAVRAVSNDDKIPVFTGGWHNDARYLDLMPTAQPANKVINYDVWLKEDGQLYRGRKAILDLSSSRYFFSDGTGNGMFFAGQGTVRHHPYGEGGGGDKIIATDVAIRDGSGQGDLAIWLAGVNSSLQRVQGWAPDGLGTRDLLDIPLDGTKPYAYSHQIALSTTRMVGTLPVPKSAELYNVAGEFRMWTSPRASTKEQASLTVSPPLPLGDRSLHPNEMKTWGDFALIQMADMGALQPLHWVVHLPTWKVFVIDIDPDFQIVSRTYAIDDKAAYIGYQGRKEKNKFHIKRIDLDKLDKTASQVLTTP